MANKNIKLLPSKVDNISIKAILAPNKTRLSNI